jgi:HPt (histidine-containing phosphotransfer) domain-containing protein
MPSKPPPPDIPEGLEHMLPLFVSEMAKDAARLAELAGSLSAAGMMEELADHAHAMRGKAGLFGETRLYDLLTRVEQSALAGEDAPLPALVERVVERSDQLGVYGRETTAG